MLNEKEKQKFSGPYDGLPLNAKINTSITVGDADRAFLFSICPHQSVLQVTMTTLLAEFIRSLKANGIKSYDPERFKEALRSVHVTLENTKRKKVEEKI